MTYLSLYSMIFMEFRLVRFYKAFIYIERKKTLIEVH